MLDDEMIGVRAMSMLRVIHFDEEDKVEKLEQAYFQIDDAGFVMPLTIRNELAVMKELEWICRGSLEKYPTTLEADVDRFEN